MIEMEVFQFLIGRLKSKRINYDNKGNYKFQFLIGRLKSKNLTYQYIRAYPVSIPHR